MSERFIRCRVAHFRDEHKHIVEDFEYIADAIVVIKQGKIDNVLHASEAQNQGISPEKIEDKRPALLMPGFIDAHVHSPQLNMIAAYGSQLMEWLNNYTFPEELKYADNTYSEEQAENFLDSLLAHGTTSAFVFTTSFKRSTEDIFRSALKRNMRIIAGKVLMDRHAPAQLLDGDFGIEDSRALIHEYHNRARLGYAVTPRFSGTSTPKQMSEAGKLLREFPDVWLQTHLSENKSEIEWTRSLFPEANDYLHTYEMHGLHTDRSIYAHCIHLNDSERARIADTGSTIAFCPSSNLFLGSGLLNLQTLHSENIKYCLASDVGAGTSLCMLKTMGDAYKVSQLNNYSLSAYEAFHAATLGAARSLYQEKYIGNLARGKEADLVLINPKLNSHLDKRIGNTSSIEEELFVYMIMGDERLIDETYIAGELAYKNPQQSGALSA